MQRPYKYTIIPSKLLYVYYTLKKNIFYNGMAKFI